MAESVLVTFPREIVGYLIPQALEHVEKLGDVKQELVALGNTVATLWFILYDAEENYYRNDSIRDWLEVMKDAFYDAQDVLEEFNIEAIRRELRGHNEMFKEVRTFFSSSNQIAFKWKMSSKVRAVRKRIEAIKADRTFHLDERIDLQVDREWRNREEMDLFIHEGDIVGREYDKEEVMKFLLDSNVKENVSILPIVGIGGLGKTALVKCIYNSKMVNKHFQLKMWVRVSDDLDVKKIVRTIILCAKKKERTTIAMGRMESELKAEIDGKRYLLVLDDVSNAERETWLSLETLLVGGGRGSKILITTRFPLVAKNTSTTPPYFLEGLSECESLDLLLLMACQKIEERHDNEKYYIGIDIVKRCFGIPLIVRTVGRLLFLRKTTFEWLSIKDNELSNNHKLFKDLELFEDYARSVLKISYDNLPPHLKQCFAFCSLFPKGYEIKKQTLINLWVAEGFIQPSGNKHLVDVAHECFMDLLSSNFFQDYEKDTETCKMHDLMHDLARLVAGFECRVAWDDPRSINNRTHHISTGLISNLVGKFPVLGSKASSLKTFLFAPTYREMERKKPTSEADLCQLIQTFKRLRILDLHAAIVKKVPMSICELKYLTYLDLSHNNALKRLPNSITRLQNLKTLNLQGCFALEELPRDIGKLVCLQNLNIDYCHSLSYMPRGLGQLISLHWLTRFILPQGKALAKNYCGLGELNGLNNIRGSLSIENLGHSRNALANGAANLIGKSLESLILKWSYLDTYDAVIDVIDEALLDGLTPHINLRKLTIHGYLGRSFPKWIMDDLVFSLPNLVEVCLLRCGRCKHLPPLGQLPHLKSLEIWRLTELVYIDSDHFSTSTASFPSLLRLEIQYCENLKAMPLAPRLENLVLRKVKQEFMNQILSGLINLKSLDISRVEFLEYLPEECLQSLTSLEHLDISECPRFKSISFGLRHLSNLLHLSFSNCEELNLSIDESGNILDFQGLVSLQSVDILGIPKLAYLPRWLLYVNNLEHLSIKKCLNLKALPQQIEALQSLQRLEIVRCPKLTSLPEGIQSLASLRYLKIAGSPYLEEACKNDTGEDWDKIARIPYVTHKLEYYERDL